MVKKEQNYVYVVIECLYMVKINIIWRDHRKFQIFEVLRATTACFPKRKKAENKIHSTHFDYQKIFP